MKKIIFVAAVFLFCSCKKEGEHLLAIGDSHGAAKHGWVAQLSDLRPQDSIFNLAIGGATIGFDNLGRDTLNTLANIEGYLKRAEAALPAIDHILVLLGTNDCKAVFDTLQDQAVENLDGLIKFLTDYNYPAGKAPEIILITPPSAGADSVLLEKYTGITGRLENLVPHYKKIAEKYGAGFVNSYDLLKPDIDRLNEDGIHLTAEGYRRIAEAINQKLPAR